MGYQSKREVIHMKMYAYEDGEFVKEVTLDVENKSEVDSVMDELFGDTEWEREDTDGEVMILISEEEYLVSNKY